MIPEAGTEGYPIDKDAFKKQWIKDTKGDAKEENHIKDWKVGEKWVDSIIEFRRYLTELYKLKHPNSADWKAKSE